MSIARSTFPPGIRTQSTESQGQETKIPQLVSGARFPHPHLGFQVEQFQGLLLSVPHHISSSWDLSELPSIPFQWHIQGPGKWTLSGSVNPVDTLWTGPGLRLRLFINFVSICLHSGSWSFIYPHWLVLWFRMFLGRKYDLEWDSSFKSVAAIFS